MGALQGLKILDFSTLLPGPYATLMLADLGAEVLKISSRGRADLALEYPPYCPGTDLSANQAWLNRNKKTMFLNLKTPKACEIVKKLVLEYDIVMEQNRPGVMDRLGLGYEDLKAVNPAVIYCSLTGYGQTGPLRLRAGHDINYLARSGNMAHAGRRETGPVLTKIQIADLAVGSLNSVVGILAAVQHRNRTGQGQFVDIAMLDGLIPFHSMDGAGFLVNGVEPVREGGRLNGGSLYDFYETADGGYLSVGSLEPKFWAAFCQAIGCPELIPGGPEPENLEEVKDKVRTILKSKTLEQWTALFQQTDACVEPVLSVEQALNHDPQIQAREMVVEVPLPAPYGPGRTVRQLGSPIKLSQCPAEYLHAGYPLGYHTVAILQDLGYSDEEIAQMEDSHVFD